MPGTEIAMQAGFAMVTEIDVGLSQQVRRSEQLACSDSVREGAHAARELGPRGSTSLTQIG
eukprot:306980-Amphidinium_carterae.1